MKQSKHTPAPWFVDDEYYGNEIVIKAEDPGDDPWLIAELSLGITQDFSQEKANAHLIAAAPELLEALERIEGEDFPSGRCTIKERLDWVKAIAKDAIAKAKGEDNV